MPRDLTAAEAKWIKRLQRALDGMPETLRGYHTPGSIHFFDPADAAALAQMNADQGLVIETIRSPSLDLIDAGDW